MVTRRFWNWTSDAIRGARKRLAHLPRHPLFSLTLLGVCVRLVLMPYTSWPFDTYFFYRAAVDMVGGGDPYASGFYTYPPLFAYSYYSPVLLASLWHSLPSMVHAPVGLNEVASVTGMVAPAITGPAFNIALKAPIFLADLAAGLLLYSYASKWSDADRAKTVFALWYLNPLVIMAGSVAGHFDSIPAALTLASMGLIMERKNLLGGATMGLGALFKAYPVFLGIAFLGLVIHGGRTIASSGKSHRVAREVLAYMAGGLIAIATFMIPLTLTRGPSLISRWATSFGVGGLSVWSLSKLPFFSGIPSMLHGLQPGLQISLLAMTAGVSLVLAGFSMWSLSRLSGVPLSHAVGLGLSSTSALYLTLTTVNPQYLLWGFPFLVLAATRFRRAWNLVMGLSVVALGYYLALQSPLAFLYPLAVFSQVLDTQTLNASILAYWGQEVLSLNLVDSLLFVFGFLGFLLILFSLLFGITLIRPDGGPKGKALLAGDRKMGPNQNRGRRTVGHIVAVLGVAAVLLTVQVAIFVKPAPRQATFELESAGTVTSADGFQATEVTYSFHGGHTPTSLQVVAMHLTRLDIHRPVYYYYDTEYPVIHLDPAGWRFLGSLIGSELSQRQYPYELEFVSATDLSKVLNSGCECIVVLASSVLPNTVFSEGVNLVTPFLESGGVLVWIGDLIGGYVGFKGETTVEWDSPANLQWEGEERILGAPIIHWAAEMTQANIPTLSARALALQFQQTRVGALLPDLTASDGRAVGFVQNGSHPRSSISLVPVGGGVLVHFGNHARSPAAALPVNLVAQDIAQILISGLAFSLSPPVFSTHDLGSGSPEMSKILVPLPSGELEPAAISVYAFTLGTAPFLSWSRVSPLTS